MKVVILTGGYGTRISEETANRPKPLIEIGDKPILWSFAGTGNGVWDEGGKLFGEDKPDFFIAKTVEKSYDGIKFD